LTRTILQTQIDLSFVQSFNTEDEIFICQGDSVFIDNVWVKNEGNYINNLISAQQCDSIVDVTLTFYPPAESLLDPVLCEGGMIIVNGTVYDEDNRTGMETLENASANGCDSIVTINLSFSDEIKYQDLVVIVLQTPLYLSSLKVYSILHKSFAAMAPLSLMELSMTWQTLWEWKLFQMLISMVAIAL